MFKEGKKCPSLLGNGDANSLNITVLNRYVLEDC